MLDGNKVFVIIVTYKGHQWYDRCFSSLRNSSLPVQTVVVDNASNDGTIEKIISDYPEIILLQSDTNLGFGQANNVGLKYALSQGCDYVFLLNQDTWIEPNTIQDLVCLHKKHPKYGILSPMHIKADGKSLYIQIEDGKTDHGNQLLSDCYFQCLKEVYPFQYVNAAAWLLPRSTLEMVGGFDPIFIHYGEDDDYLNRLRYHGLSLGLCPLVRIVHDHQCVPNPLSSGRMRYYQSLMGTFVDPNKPASAKKYIRYLWRKVMSDLLKGKFQNAKMHRLDAKFIHSKIQAIDLSRSINCLKQPSWLQ